MNLSEISTSLKVVSEMLHDRKFNVSKLHLDNETLKVLKKNNKLEFYLENENNICFVKYILQKPRPSNIKQTIEEIGDLIKNRKNDNKNINIILILNTEPGQTIEKTVNNISVTEGFYIQLFMYKRLLFNITKHISVPKHRMLCNDEITQLITSLKLKNKQQLPVILKNDPIAQYYGMKTGDICEIERISITSGKIKIFRLCR